MLASGKKVATKIKGYSGTVAIVTGAGSGIGRAISFAAPDQAKEVRGIERLIRVVLPISKLPDLPPARALPPEPRQPSYGRGQSNRFSRNRR